ncbi:serine/threonine-protein kinase [Actinomadura sp. KC216]|uniref:serine/threonine protein kinase n=1 Tax=Actinomadura sp. KC216 TaxID=2530370 RepID=UPI0014042D15|nr:serine/threonine-protein kinase [Actinomadura sp. KC216]
MTPLRPPGTTIAGTYLLDHKVSEGGQAELWAARDLRGNDLVAVKLFKEISPAAARLARREISILGDLPPSPYVVAVRDHGTEGDLLFLVMEWIEGRPLSNDSLHRPRLQQVQRWCVQLCRGLALCHERGVFHRDIKPANVMITEAGDAKLVDFGIARTLQSSLTAPGVAAGSPAYMAPERWLERGGDHRTDLYSLGCLMYELLTGEPPFGPWIWNTNTEQLRNDHLYRTPVPPAAGFSGVPEALDRLVMDLLAKEPGHRPQSADEVIVRLDEIVRPTAGATVIDAEGRPATSPVPDVPHVDPGSLAELRAADAAVRDARRRYGENHLLTLEARANLAECIARSGDLEGAVRTYDELIVDYQRECGPYDPNTQRLIETRMMWVLGKVPPPK